MENSDKSKLPNRPPRISIVILGFIIGYLLVGFISNIQYSKAKKEIQIDPYLTYSEFTEMVSQNQIERVVYFMDTRLLHAYPYLRDTKGQSYELRMAMETPDTDYFNVQVPNIDFFILDLLNHEVIIEYAYANNPDVNSSRMSFVTSICMSILTGVAVLSIFYLIMYFLGRNAGFGLPIGGVNTSSTLVKGSDVRFSDIIGHDEIIDDIKFITEMIKDPTKGQRIGAKVPHGYLFIGPPGTGKTMIAKAIAGEADVNFISANASRFTEMFVGVGPRRVHDLFKEARQNTPCIVFIDEIDSVGSRGDGVINNSEDNKTINALLQEMDGFTARENIFVIAATNNENSIDPALTRSGRFDRQIIVSPPKDWHVRSLLFSHYLKDFRVSEDVDIDNLSKQTSGFTGADIQTICNEASIIAVMRDLSYITNNCIEEAIDRKIFKGNRAKDQQKQKEDRNIVAYHEAGHAVMTYLCNRPIARASIIATVSGVGGAVFQQDNDSQFMTEEDLRYQVMIAYAGRASEEIKFQNVTTGASNDITQATKILVNYIEHLGFSKEYGLVDVSVLQQGRLVSNTEIDKQVFELSNKLYQETLRKLKDNYKLVELLAQQLLSEATLSGETITDILDKETSECTAFLVLDK